MTSNDYYDLLRERAKDLIDQNPDRLKELKKEDIIDLVEELHIHQIELEIQNEELQSYQRRLEKNRFRFVNLFENAPVGYVILDRVGLIKHFNATFLDFVPNLTLKPSGTAFADLLSPEDAAEFRGRYNALFKSPEGKQFQAKLCSADNRLKDVLIEARHQTDQPDNDDDTFDELFVTITDISDLQKTKQQYKYALDRAHGKELEISALLDGAKAILENKDFQTTARQIFDTCSQIIGSASGYVALLTDDGKENEVLFLEDGGLACTVDPDLPMPIRGLREQAYQDRKTVYNNHFMSSQWSRYLPKGHVRLDNVLFTPLIIEGKAIGVMGLANKPTAFTENDAKIAGGFGELAAIALKNARLQDKRDQTEKENINLIEELKVALENVKTLSGLMPICQHCKKVRDDKGYWNQIELYIEQHSDAQLSHSICRDCAERFYPELNLYED